MRFLTETISKERIQIILDDGTNYLIHKQNIKGLTNIEIDCTKYMSKWNLKEKTYRKINYKVQVHNSEEIIKGSFPIISPFHTDSLKFVTLSCNNNKKKDDKNDYSFQRVNQEIDIWEHLASQDPDIILHLGDNVYADYVLENKIGYNRSLKITNSDTIYQAFAKLYKTAYGETSQSYAMRNSLNIMILDDHEVSNSFGTPGSGCTAFDSDYYPYYEGGMKAFLDYQYSLHSNLTIDEYYNIINGKQPIYYTLDYGKYTIIALDERHMRFFKREIFTDDQINWFNDILKNTLNEKIIIMSSRPFGHLNYLNAWILSFFTDGGKDELFHPSNYERTKSMLKIMDQNKDLKDIIIVAGDVHKTFINKIKNKNNEQIARQLVSSALTRKPKGYLNFFGRIFHSLQQGLVCFNMKNFKIGKRHNESYNNNYGIIKNDQLNNYYIKGYNITLSFMNK
jgi:phosphodiesterase/alkaline phosphatase D-like protein